LSSYVSVFEIITLKIRTMKKKIFGLGIFLLSFMGMATAQYCPTPVRGNNVGNTLGFGTASPYFNSLGAASLNNIIYDFSFALDRGFRSGDLTRNEVFILENDLDRLARRMRSATLDGRLTRSELTFLEWDMDNFRRRLAREWNDRDRRDLG